MTSSSDGQRSTANGQRSEQRSDLDDIRDRLLGAQLKLKNSPTFAQLLIITGMPTAGRSETVNRLLEWVDPKFVDVNAFAARDQATRARPLLWRYWQALPGKGRLGIHFGGWYQDLFDCVMHSKEKDAERYGRTVERIRLLEEALQSNGVRLTKVHLHVAKEMLRKRIKTFESDKLTRWRVTDEDRWYAEHYGKAAKTFERCRERTHTDAAPWHVVDGSDADSRMFEVGRLLLTGLEQGFTPNERKADAAPPRAATKVVSFPSRPAKNLDGKEYKEELQRLQGHFVRMTRKKRFQKHSLVFAFEGMDAAGKGGAIKRITTALDARHYRVVPVSAPSPEEQRYPYLWRFWKHVPSLGRIAIFDRSWYGRVLVERVRGFATANEWQRAYDEINEFERELAEHGTIVLKFWLSVSLEEQLARFKERDADPLKRFKVDPEDWKNREHYAEYQAAAQDMLKRTDSKHAPWTVVQGDDKQFARLKVLRRICEEMEERM
jgi:polyphosphate:AMP phosphotransferase